MGDLLCQQHLASGVNRSLLKKAGLRLRRCRKVSAKNSNEPAQKHWACGVPFRDVIKSFGWWVNGTKANAATSRCRFSNTANVTWLNLQPNMTMKRKFSFLFVEEELHVRRHKYETTSPFGPPGLTREWAVALRDLHESPYTWFHGHHLRYTLRLAPSKFRNRTAKETPTYGVTSYGVEPWIPHTRIGVAAMHSFLRLLNAL